MVFHQPVEILASERAIRNHTDVAGAVGDFPGFTDWNARRERFFVKSFEISSTPHSLLEDWAEGEWIEHCGSVKTLIVKTLNRNKLSPQRERVVAQLFQAQLPSSRRNVRRRETFRIVV